MVAALALPGQDVLYNPAHVTVQQVQSLRASYVNGILINRAGQLRLPPCTNCANRPGGLAGRPFPECRNLVGHWNNVCGNCKWYDGPAGSCSFRVAGGARGGRGGARGNRGARGARGGRGGRGGGALGGLGPDDDDDDDNDDGEFVRGCSFLYLPSNLTIL